MGGDVAGDEGRGSEDDGDKGEGGDVPGADLEEQTAKERGGAERAQNSGSDADDGEDAGFAEDELVDGAALGSEGHADTDLAGALADGVGDDAVEADDAEEERESGEASDEPCGGTMQVGGLRVVDALLHGQFVDGADAGVDLMNGGGERGQDGLCVA